MKNSVSELDLAPPPQSQGPQPVDRQRASVEAAHLTKKIPGRVEYIDAAVAEIADKDIPAKAAEGQRALSIGVNSSVL